MDAPPGAAWFPLPIALYFEKQRPDHAVAVRHIYVDFVNFASEDALRRKFLDDLGAHVDLLGLLGGESGDHVGSGATLEPGRARSATAASYTL